MSIPRRRLCHGLCGSLTSRMSRRWPASSTGVTSTKGSCGTEHFKGLQPGNVIGQIIDYLRGKTPSQIGYLRIIK